MSLSAIGEFGLIDRIQTIIGTMPNDVLLGPGDDTAVYRPTPGKEQLITTDGLTEGIHFDLAYTPFLSLGKKAIAANLSDIAAMGGLPRYAVVTLAIPVAWQTENVEQLISGMVCCADVHGCKIIGGDITGSKSGGFISITITGEVESGRAVKRSTAAEGDLLCLSGPVGSARTGLEVLKSGVDREEFNQSIKKFLEPCPRVALAAQLAEKQLVTSMIDISDGLSSEIIHICQSSSVGCVLSGDDVPINSETAIWAEKTQQALLPFALESGEEYELLFTVSPDADTAFLSENGVYIIGKMQPESAGIIVQQEGREFELQGTGWNHFSV